MTSPKMDDKVVERRSGRNDRRTYGKLYSLCPNHKDVHWVGIDQAQTSVTFTPAPTVCQICEHNWRTGVQHGR